MSKLILKINEPNKHDSLLINLLFESYAGEVFIELKDIAVVKISNKFKGVYFGQIDFFVNQEGHLNIDPEHLMSYLRKLLHKTAGYFTSFKYEIKEVEPTIAPSFALKGRRREKNIGEYYQNWITYFNFEKMQLSKIDWKLSRNFINEPENFQFLLDNSLTKIKNMRKIKLDLQLYQIEKQEIAKFMQVLENSSKSLISFDLQHLVLMLKKWNQAKKFLAVVFK